MLALQIENIRDFMKKLLLQDTFDAFLVSEVSVTTFVTYRIDGTLHPDFYSSEEEQALRREERSRALWKEIRPFCLAAVRGRQQPLSLHIVLQLPEDQSRALLEEAVPSLDPADLFGLFLNIRFRDHTLTVTTGTSARSFMPGHSLDDAWDALVRDLLKKEGML